MMNEPINQSSLLFAPCTIHFFYQQSCNMSRKIIDSCLRLDKRMMASAASITLLTFSTMPTNVGKIDNKEMTCSQEHPNQYYCGNASHMNETCWNFFSRLEELVTIERTHCDTASQPQKPSVVVKKICWQQSVCILVC